MPNHKEETVYITCCDDGEEWVTDVLSPFLHKQNVLVLTKHDATIGMSLINARKDLISKAGKVIFVISPSSTHNINSSLDAKLFYHDYHLSPELKTIPILYKVNETIEIMSHLVCLQFNDEHFEEKLIASLFYHLNKSSKPRQGNEGNIIETTEHTVKVDSTTMSSEHSQIMAPVRTFSSVEGIGKVAKIYLVYCDDSADWVSSVLNPFLSKWNPMIVTVKDAKEVLKVSDKVEMIIIVISPLLTQKKLLEDIRHIYFQDMNLYNKSNCIPILYGDASLKDLPHILEGITVLFSDDKNFEQQLTVCLKQSYTY